MSIKIPKVEESIYNKDPNVYSKEYSPFGIQSSTWRVFYFVMVSRKGRRRGYESYGRTMSGARRGLEIATGRTGFKSVTKSIYQSI